MRAAVRRLPGETFEGVRPRPREGDEMEITRTLGISAEEFFDQIEATIIADIEEATGKKVPRAKLNGYKYKKRARGGGKGGTPMGVKIKRYRYPEVYEVRFSYASGTSTACYRVAEAGEDTVTIEYTETFEAQGKADKGIFGGINRAIYERRLRRHAVQTLKAIEEAARQDRRARDNNPLLTKLEEEDEAAE